MPIIELQIYEISIELESGYTLNMLVSSTSADQAKFDAHKVLRSFREFPTRVYNFAEMTAKPVKVEPII